MSFNFMATVTICSDFGVQKMKSVTVSTVSPSICHEVKGTRCHDLSFLQGSVLSQIFHSPLSL